jgi:hypothetical protein
MGDAARPPPIPPPCAYRSTRPLRRHPPFGLERNHLFSLYAPAHLGTIMSSSLGRAPPHPPPRNGDPAFLYSCRSCAASVLMYAKSTSLLTPYIRNTIPRIRAFLRRRSWPYRTGPHSGVPAFCCTENPVEFWSGRGDERASLAAGPHSVGSNGCQEIRPKRRRKPAATPLLGKSANFHAHGRSFPWRSFSSTFALATCVLAPPCVAPYARA